MKKIISLVAAAATAVMMNSCEIVKQDIKPLTDDELADYAGKLFSNSVLLPVELADVAITIDEYLALPEEQKSEYSRYIVRAISDGVYQVSDYDMSCIIDTGGCSVWEDGAEWKFLSFISRIPIPSSYGYGTWRTSLTDNAYLTFNTDTMGEAKLMVQVEVPGGKALMSLRSREGGVSVWNLSVEGTDVGSDGLCAEYGTGYDTGGVNVTRELLAQGSHKTYQGVFFVDIYKNGGRLAMIEMTLYSNSSAQYDITR